RQKNPARDAKRRQRRVQYPPFDQLPEQLFLPPGQFVLCGAELMAIGRELSELRDEVRKQGERDDS
ncbi:hypothetical protein ACSLNR_29770, partial [Escherichia coli]